MMLSHIVYTNYILQVHLMKGKRGGTALIVNSQHIIQCIKAVVLCVEGWM